MNWIELEQKHKREWKQFEELKRASWDTIEKNRKEMYAAFGDHDAKIPMSVFEKVRQEKEHWKEAWGDNGYKAKYLLAIHKTEMKELKEQTKSSTKEYMRQGRDKQRQKSKDRERDD